MHIRYKHSQASSQAWGRWSGAENAREDVPLRQQLEDTRVERDAERAASEAAKPAAKEGAGEQAMQQRSVHGQQTPEQGYCSQIGHVLRFVTSLGLSQNSMRVPFFVEENGSPVVA